MLNFRQLFGQSGEHHAVRYLKKNGYHILATNYRNRIGEIDIIAKEGETLVFVEVKTRSRRFFVHPKEAVTRKKQIKITRVAQYWLKANHKTGVRVRFDVVAVLSDHRTYEIELIKNAFTL
ncbi:YraN family protein [Desulfatiferula olefinivorans]